MSTQHPLFLGVGSHVVALDRVTGGELWRTKLKSSPFVTLTYDGHALFAGCGGEVFCLDPPTGEIRWRNRLPRLGHGLVAFEGTSPAGAAAAIAAEAVATSTATS